jgi:cytochrome c biogenesis protein CcdA
VENVSYLAAFVVGLLSIISPCILPVVPFYVAYLPGSTERSAQARTTLLINALAYTSGARTLPGDSGRATVLLSVLSGFGDPPFLDIAGAGASSHAIRRIFARSATAGSGSGAVLLAVGIIMVLGIYRQAFVRIVSLAPWTPIVPARL